MRRKDRSVEGGMCVNTSYSLSGVGLVLKLQKFLYVSCEVIIKI